MASIANWVIILVIITSITFIRLSIIIIALINIIFYFSPRTKFFVNEAGKLWEETLVTYKWVCGE